MKKQADGRYKSKVVVGKTGDGQNIVKWISGRTKKELEADRQRVIAEYRDGVSGSDKTVMSVDWIVRWFDVCAAPQMKPAVAAQKRRRIEIYIAPHLKDKQLRAVTAFDLQDIVNAVDKGHTVQQNVLSVLRGAFRAAYAQGIIPRDVTASLTARLKPYEPRRALTEHESKAIEESLLNRSTARLMAALLYYTGMRRGEALALRWSDVDMRRDVIHVRRSLTFKTMQFDPPKTDAGVRDIPLCPELKSILAEEQGIGDRLLVHDGKGKPLKEMAFRGRWRKVQAVIGSEEVTPHYFRHNYATRLYDAGVDVLTASKVLGHSDPATTLRIYTDIQNSRRVTAGSETVRRAFEKK